MGKQLDPQLARGRILNLGIVRRSLFDDRVPELRFRNCSTWEKKRKKKRTRPIHLLKRKILNRGTSTQFWLMFFVVLEIPSRTVIGTPKTSAVSILAPSHLWDNALDIVRQIIPRPARETLSRIPTMDYTRPDLTDFSLVIDRIRKWRRATAIV
jgi:hypothetical protein